MSEKLIYFLQRTMRKTWWRCALFSAFAVLAVVLSAVLGPRIPQDVALKLGSASIDSLLNILASSMLTVAIFSASTMVSSFSAVASSATPRASQLVIEDTTIQNTLAAFIGAFLYSVIALVGLHAHVYGDGGRLILFGFTLVILLLVVIVLLRWIDYLSVLGRLGETIRRVEVATLKSMDQRLEKPFLGGRPQRDGERGAVEVKAPLTGYVQHVSMDLLQARARKNDLMLNVHVLPGAFIERGALMVSSSGELDDESRKAICEAVLIGAARTFDHDPRFGLVVMGEIAARALSAAVNDPGTCMDVMSAAVKVISHWSDRRRAPEPPGGIEVVFDRVSAPGLREAGMVEDAFAPIARYGAAAVEIGVVLQRALKSLQGVEGDIGEAAAEMSRYAMNRALHAGLMEADIAALHAVANARGDTSGK